MARSIRVWSLLFASACGGAGTSPCHPAGSYRTHTDDGTLPCCAGLTRVTTGTAAYADSSETARVCLSDDSGFSCIEGSCGDGVCDPYEALPCGCASDCAAQSWAPNSVGPTMPAAPGACSGLGAHPHVAGVDLPACCAGLNRLETRVAVFEGGAHACVQDDPLSFACTMGTCGDGMCEPAEALPCVCPPDCPSAVWESERPGDAGS